jgi:hypothetical protein
VEKRSGRDPCLLHELGSVGDEIQYSLRPTIKGPKVIYIRVEILCIEYGTYEKAGWAKLVKEIEGLKGRIPKCVREEPASRKQKAAR